MNKIVNIGRIKQHEKSAQLCVDNPSPFTSSGKVNTYHKGMLIYRSEEDGKFYLVKNMTISDVDSKNGFDKNVWIKLGDKFYVEELNE